MNNQPEHELELALEVALNNRHPSTKHFGPLLRFSHLPPELQRVSAPATAYALAMVENLKDGPELSTGLRKLVEGKDCFVRQAVIDNG